MKRKLPKITRDTGLFLVGLGLTINEAILREGERPYLLMLFAGMMGLPVFLRNDEKKQEEAPAPPPVPPIPPTPEIPPTPPPVAPPTPVASPPSTPPIPTEGGSFS